MTHGNNMLQCMLAQWQNWLLLRLSAPCAASAKMRLVSVTSKALEKCKGKHWRKIVGLWEKQKADQLTMHAKCAISLSSSCRRFLTMDSTLMLLWWAGDKTRRAALGFPKLQQQHQCYHRSKIHLSCLQWRAQTKSIEKVFLQPKHALAKQSYPRSEGWASQSCPNQSDKSMAIKKQLVLFMMSFWKPSSGCAPPDQMFWNRRISAWIEAMFSKDRYMWSFSMKAETFIFPCVNRLFKYLTSNEACLCWKSLCALAHAVMVSISLWSFSVVSFVVNACISACNLCGKNMKSIRM